MAGASKPKPGSKVRPVKVQDGARKSGGIGTAQHAGPKRASKTPSSGTRGAQLQRKTQP
jgi:hypothetical protein